VLFSYFLSKNYQAKPASREKLIFLKAKISKPTPKPVKYDKGVIQKSFDDLHQSVT
jgi:hypothetical protein